MKKVVSIVLSITITALLTIPAFAAKTDKHYSYVLVHGLGGWGDSSSINDLSPYWGSKTGNLAKYMNSQGYKTVEASVGPFSSTWDRACELYAQLTGTTVDYGEAHSAIHNHSRYGKTYTESIIGEWDEDNPVNLIGHSFGGETVRLLASLMAYGDDAEKIATGKNTSELFTGGKADWVHSVVTLCSPHNGSTLYYIVDSIPGLVEFVLSFVHSLGYITDITSLNKFYDVSLRQFERGIFENGKDNAGYELSPEGAEELNKTIKTVDSVYYFSFSSVATHKQGNNQIPDSNILPVLYLTSLSMGLYNDEKLSKENDGLVNVNSAQYPFGDKHQSFLFRTMEYADSNNIQPGSWYVMPTMRGHHGTIIGMDGNTGEIHMFYDSLFGMLNRI